MSAHNALALVVATLIVGIPAAMSAWLATLLSRKPDARDYADMDETVPRADGEPEGGVSEEGSDGDPRRRG